MRQTLNQILSNLKSMDKELKELRQDQTEATRIFDRLESNIDKLEQGQICVQVAIHETHSGIAAHYKCDLMERKIQKYVKNM